MVLYIFFKISEESTSDETPQRKIIVMTITIASIVFALMIFGLGYMALRLVKKVTLLGMLLCLFSKVKMFSAELKYTTK